MSNTEATVVGGPAPEDVRTRILETLQNANTIRIVVKVGPADYKSWYLSRTLLCDASAEFKRVFVDPKTTEITWNRLEPAFDLFVEWLYFGSYREHDGYAIAQPRDGSGYSLAPLAEPGPCKRTWRVQAALLSHHLGYRFGAPKFQNYAIARLLQAYSIDRPKTMISPNMFHFPTKPNSSLRRFLEDVIIRNWGDPTVLNNDTTLWWSSVSDQSFQLRFMEAMALPLEARQREPMVLEKYLVEED